MNSEEEFTVIFLKRHLGILRLFTFREDDRNNRRLLFDSGNLPNDATDPARPSRCHDPDSKLLAEMIFGSTPTVCNGESIKVHQFRGPSRIMFTKLFPAHQLTSCSNSIRRDQCRNAQRRFSVDPERIGIKSSGSGCGEMVTPNYSSSDLMAPRTTSPNQSRRSSESSDECEVLPALHRLRRQRIGVAVLCTVGEETQTGDELIVRRRIRYLCSQAPAVFTAIREDLQDVVLTAYCTRTSVAEIMKRAWQRFLTSMKSMCESTCRAHYLLPYFKMAWSFDSSADIVHFKQFVETLSALGAKYDTKQTNFFLSSMVTSILGLEKKLRLANGRCRCNQEKGITEIRVTCNDGRLLLQLLEIMGYFLKFVVSDFDRLSVTSVPLSITRSVSWRSTPKGSGALASILNILRSKKAVRENSISEKSMNDSARSSGISPGFGSPSPPSASIIPVIYVEGNGLTEENVDRYHTSAHREHCPKNEVDEAVSVSSSIKSSTSVATGVSSAGDSSIGEDYPAGIFDETEERTLPERWIGVEEFRRTAEEALVPLCGDLQTNHKFTAEMMGNGRPMDMAVAIWESMTNNDDSTHQALIVDATTWKVYNATIDDTSSNLAVETFKPRFPSAVITELLENVRGLGTDGFDANYCLMYLEDEIKSLLVKASMLARFALENSKPELCSEFCTKVLRCDFDDISFLM